MRELPVIFRIMSGEVFALFPTVPHDTSGHYCVSYTHVGQHGSADYHTAIANSRPASAESYTPLLTELQEIGYNTRVVKRATQAMHKERSR